MMWTLNLYGQNYFECYYAYAKSRNSFPKRPAHIQRRNIALKAGDSIHLKSRNGMYKIHMLIGDEIIITCNKWQQEHARKQRDYALQRINKSEFKCLAGSPFTSSKHVDNQTPRSK